MQPSDSNTLNWTESERKHIEHMKKVGAEIAACSKKHPMSPAQFLAQVKRLRAGSENKSAEAKPNANPTKSDDQRPGKNAAG